MAATKIKPRKDIQEVLRAKGQHYGDFLNHARITQNIKRALVDSKNWEELPDAMKESLEMVAHKIGRLLNGNPLYKDSWIDMIGYLQLIVNDLED